MEQLNTVLPAKQEENSCAAEPAFERRTDSPLLNKVHQNFGVFGVISLIFGILFTFLFYKAKIGMNILLFTMVMVTLLCVAIQKLSLKLKGGTKAYYIGALLLGISAALTSSDILQLLNVIGILLLFDLSLLHQFYDERRWDFMKHFLRMFGLFFESIAALGYPFIDGIGFMKRTKVFRNDKTRNIFLGILISLPFLWMVTALLANADLLFGKVTRKLFHVIFSADIFAVSLLTIFGFLACYCIICASVTKTGLEEEKAFPKADTSIAVTFMAILCIVYALFCGIQIIYLFANGLFVLPEEFTFAEYARRGFFELLAVAIINVSLMVVCRAFFKDSKALRLIITFMTLCTYIMIASATYRMLLYISVYHLTFLRIFVLLSLLIIALILAGVIVSEYKQEFPLFKYCVAVVSICYIAFSFAKPDYHIASYLIDHSELLDRDDVIYLSQELSLDAAPAILPVLSDQERWSAESAVDDDQYDIVRDKSSNILSRDLQADYYQRIERSAAGRNIRDFDYSVYLAEKAAEAYPMN